MLQNPPPPPPQAAANPQWMMPPQQQQQAQTMQPHQMMQPQQVMQALPPPPVMQHPQGMMQPQQIMQPQPFFQPHRAQPQTQDEVRTLWIGDLQYWMDEGYVHNCFAHTGEVQAVKVIRNRQTGQSEGYGFIEFTSHATAEKILQSYQGSQMPQTELAFRLNWASSGSGGENRPETMSEHSIFIGDLAPDVSDFVLQETFRNRYPSVQSAKVVIDTLTGSSKGYGFVRFGDELERIRAMTEMNGVYCSSRPMRISAATARKSLGPGQQVNYKSSYQGGYNAHSQTFSNENDPNNTTVFVGGLDPNVTDEELRQVFSQFGEIIYVKIPSGKGCGFIQFTNRASAEEALQKLHGSILGQQTIRLSWGRSSTYKQRQPSPSWGQPQQDPNQWNGGGYYGYGQGQQGQGYDGYGYAAPQDPVPYAQGSYAQYGAYPQQNGH